MLTQPNGFDIVDTEYFNCKLAPSGNILVAGYADQDDNTRHPYLGKIGGKKFSDQGTAPKKVFYLKMKIQTNFRRANVGNINPDGVQRIHGIRPDHQLSAVGQNC